MVLAFPWLVLDPRLIGAVVPSRSVPLIGSIAAGAHENKLTFIEALGEPYFVVVARVVPVVVLVGPRELGASIDPEVLFAAS